ncbi:hypothetical protein HPB48_013211 [Haemaphysalis longicornis]|uniref:Ionotropic receptor n=1 Tax=Haemaphysalis longicornis TaxID=44386 RepID=A0A9J6GV42_HAELO|nr:hypothetical protein HPB48_013211 [Haemaphysalis longicornis]
MTSSHSRYFQSILEALRHSNATIIFKTFGNWKVAHKEMRCGRADILWRPQAVAQFPGISFPAVLLYAREAFYAYSGVGERWASSFMVFEQSQVALALLLTSGVAVWLVLSVAGSIASGTTLNWHVNWHAILDSATLTVSSLLSVSVSTIFDEARSRSRSLGATTTILLAIWLLGTIPLLVYFRALLTSRLSLSVPPNPVDTLEELEAHLDSGEVQPCVVKGNAMHFRFTSNESLDPGIYQKLRTTYNSSPRKEGLTFDNFESCWNHCATKPGFVCIHFSSNELVAHYRPEIPASREHFGLHLTSVPVRKDFPQMRALRNLMNRMSETGLYGRVNEYDKEGVAQNSNERLLNAKEEVKAIKLSELRSFCVCFLALYVLSFVVCCLEVLTVHWKPHRLFVGRYRAKPYRSNLSYG